uniref:Putative dual specificity phosphatase catalytic domain n=1 Tax=viral metagenome TaxID=1070528 RepID=A0A6M3XDJ5_9ZZZZ
MVFWINRILGIKAVDEGLTEEEYGSIILDLRNLVDGKNEITPLVNTIKNAIAFYTICRERNLRLILQCQAGISRAPAIAATILGLQCDYEWDEALELIKKKCPRVNINQDLLEQLRSIFR